MITIPTSGITFCGDKGPMVTISPKGEVTVNPEYSLPEAAKEFWKAVESYIQAASRS